MRRYYSIDIVALRDAKISVLWWMILEDIHFRQGSSESGWFEVDRKKFASDHGITYGSMRNILSKLSKEEWIKTNKKGHIKTTPKWFNLYSLQHSQNEKKELSSENDNGCHSKMTTLSSENDTLPIKIEVERYKKEKKVEKKEKNPAFSFSLKAKQSIENLTDEYLGKMKGRLLLEYGPKILPLLETFVLSCEANGYKYKNFYAAFVKWNANDLPDKRSPSELQDAKGLDAGWKHTGVYGDTAYAVHTKTYEIKTVDIRRQSSANEPATQKNDLDVPLPFDDDKNPNNGRIDGQVGSLIGKLAKEVKCE